MFTNLGCLLTEEIKIKYCKKCGRKLNTKLRIVGYSRDTGEPFKSVYYKCPRLFWSIGGHANFSIDEDGHYCYEY